MTRERKVFLNSGLKGWGTARTELERVDHTARRELLVHLTCTAGIHGAPGLKYLVQHMRWMVDGAGAPIPSGKLSTPDIHFIERRAHEQLQPYIDAEDPRLYRTLRGVGRAA